MNDEKKPAPPPKKVLTEYLTAEELEDLHDDAKRNSEYFRKAFAHLRPKKD
jgi:hypothetical protein